MTQTDRRDTSRREVAYPPARVVPVHTQWPIRVLAITSSMPLTSATRADLMRRGMELQPYSDGTAALLGFSDDEPSAIVAPTDMHGVELVPFIDAVIAWSDVPVVVGLGPETESHETAYRALEHGARALIGLPFTSQGLSDVLRQLGVFTPGLSGPAITLTVGAMTLDPLSFRATVDDMPVPLTPREFQLMKYLMNQAPRVVSVEELTNGHNVYCDGTVAGTRVAILRLRKKLTAVSPKAAAMLGTIRGVGYRISAPA